MALRIVPVRPKSQTLPSPMQTLPLETGDRLTRAEFERRYAAMPAVKKAELIEGIVYMPSPVGRDHAKAHGLMMIWLGAYLLATPHIEMLDNNTVRLDRVTEVQPDALLRIDESCGGQSHVGAKGFIDGPPELVVEVAASSVSYDLHAKRKAYQRAGVRDYVVWRVDDHQIDWFVLHGARYVAQKPDAQGVYASTVFPGLRLAAAALLAGDLAAVVTEVQQGLQTPEHAAFVEQLKTANENAEWVG